MPNEEYLIYEERSYLSNQKTHSKGVPFFGDIFVSKVVLSLDPASNEYTAMTRYNELWFLASILKYPIA
jgi:hypothetical protein